jgi:hypothetical protein
MFENQMNPLRFEQTGHVDIYKLHSLYQSEVPQISKDYGLSVIMHEK